MAMSVTAVDGMATSFGDSRPSKIGPRWVALVSLGLFLSGHGFDQPDSQCSGADQIMGLPVPLLVWRWVWEVWSGCPPLSLIRTRAVHHINLGFTRGLRHPQALSSLSTTRSGNQAPVGSF
ncbi:hypothetical protein NPIL_36561 [Nephila pilipes]|uniref:Uncharacterized protein n=1 Tax=Nephila pilipes TaxID=299642 RepID=A0A8X6U742_NEPPI|nr:hypothetical protein NPIL_36561 [Nephila pilipes]